MTTFICDSCIEEYRQYYETIISVYPNSFQNNTCRYCDKYTNYGEYVKINSFKLIVQMKKMQEEIDELKSRKN